MWYYDLMRKIFIISVCFMLVQSVQATECTDFLTKMYADRYQTRVKIKSQKEYCGKYEQKTGNIYTSAVIYGEGDFKVKGQKKRKVSYMCLTDSEGKPFWGHINSL